MKAIGCVIGVLAAGTLMSLAGCQNSPEKIEEMIRTMEPQAVAAAKERARDDLGCDSISTKVVSRDHGDLSSQYGLQRVVYKVETRGCGRKTTLSVACVPKSPCSALAGGSTVEPDR